MIIIIGSLLGLLLLTVSLKWRRDNWNEVLRDLIRDVGIALLVAALVTIAYELHARSLYDRDNFVGMLQAVMGKVVPPEVWKAVQGTVIERDRIRGDIDIRLRVKRNPSLPQHQGTLWMDFRYYLKGLHLKEETLEVQHSLDDICSFGKLNLPRFERINIGTEEYKLSDQSKFRKSENEILESVDGRVRINRKKGKADLSVDIPPQDKPGIRIETVREELIYLPGSYSIVMSELTEGRITLTIDEWPDDMTPSAEFITDQGNKKTNRVSNTWVYSGIMLPGQSLEIRFKQKTP